MLYPYAEYLKALSEAGEPRFLPDAEAFMPSRPLCCFTGHRPKSLPFHGESDGGALRLRAELGKLIEEAYADGYRDFMSGMALGVDSWAALEVLGLRYAHPDVRLFAALPYPEQSTGWRNWEKERYQDILRLCDGVLTVSPTPSRFAPILRDRYMIARSARVIAVYNGSRTGGTAATVKMAEKREIEIVLLDPLQLTVKKEGFHE